MVVADLSPVASAASKHWPERHAADCCATLATTIITCS
jgi:hypothetical protein